MMERWKDLQPPPAPLTFSEQQSVAGTFFGGTALDPVQLQRVGINDLALIQRQLHQHQASQDNSGTSRPLHALPLPSVSASASSQSATNPNIRQYISPTIQTTPQTFSGSLSGSNTTSPLSGRYTANDDAVAAQSPAQSLNYKKQKTTTSSNLISPAAIHVAPTLQSPVSPVITAAPQQMSLTREHTIKLAEKAMDDVSTLIKFLAANEPQLLAVSNLTAAHHLISRFVAGIQKTKPSANAPSTTSALLGNLAGQPPNGITTTSALMPPLHGVFIDSPVSSPQQPLLNQQHQQQQPLPQSVVHLIPSAAPGHQPHHPPHHPTTITPSLFASSGQYLPATQHSQQSLHASHLHPHATSTGIPSTTNIPSASSASGIAHSQQQTPTALASASGAPIIRESEPLPEVAKLTDFQILDVLGTGTFGKVRLCMFKPSGRYYCMKILSKEKIIRLKQEEHILNEKNVLQSARNPFIIRLYRTFQDQSSLYFLMEYASGGELFTCIRRASRLSNTTAKFYAAEIILAISYLHDKSIVHRDLKPENLLLDAQGHIKLTDFGFAKLVTDRTYTMCGTPEYIAPEVILSKGHGKGADWWSLGVLIYEMLAGHPPFYGDSNHTVFEKILSNRPLFPSHFDALAKDIIDRLLVVEVEKRLGCGPDGVDEIKRHPWFQGTNWDAILQRQVPGPINPRTTAENDTRNFAKYGDLPEDVPEFRGENDIFKAF